MKSILLPKRMLEINLYWKRREKCRLDGSGRKKQDLPTPAYGFSPVWL